MRRAIWNNSWLGWIAATAWLVSASPAAASADFLPCSPVTEFLEPGDTGLDPDFCAEWNPEFGLRGPSCCPKPLIKRSRRRIRSSCGPKRAKASYCDEMTQEQRDYADLVTQKSADVFKILAKERGRRGPQSYCNVNNGFLAWGRQIISTPANRLIVKNAERCVNFGTDGMVGMMEWVGRQVSAQYADAEFTGVRLVVGNVSAPRGGCLTGMSGRRGHASHTSGLDIDVAFFDPAPKRVPSDKFGTQFDAKNNWWVIRQFFKNPYACVKVIFLDRRLISKLAKVATKSDPEEWEALRHHIRHVRGHRNHLHLRIGNGPGKPGCPATFDDDDLEEDLQEEVQELESAVPDSSGDSAE